MKIGKAKESVVCDNDADVVLTHRDTFYVASTSRSTGADGMEFGSFQGNVALFDGVGDQNDLF